MEAILSDPKEFLINMAVLAGAVILGLLGYTILFSVLTRVSKRTKTSFDNYLIKHIRGPMRVVIPLILVYLVIPSLSMYPENLDILKHFLSLVVIASVAWLLIQIIFIAEDVVMNQFDIEDRDNLKARKVYTQVQVFKRVVTVIISVLAFATMLMTFDKVQQLGTSILASAGVIGIIIGFAAQRTISTVFAGFQIAITQPIRIDDVVIVEDEWGRIEEITLTYVVVKIWDLRRLVLPITYFLEKPFQNWTRVTAEILGTVFLYLDYTIPLQAIRDEFQRILKESKYWDGKVSGVQVTNATERTVEVRALMSAHDAPRAWNLRCEVREKLIHFVQKNYPDALPRVRGELRSLDRNASDKQDFESV